MTLRFWGLGTGFNYLAQGKEIQDRGRGAAIPTAGVHLRPGRPPGEIPGQATLGSAG